MDNNVVIKICGLSKIEDTGENVETLAVGKYYMKNNKHYVLYDEVDEESGIKIKNTIKFNENSAEVSRKGDINGKMIFVNGENNQSLYSTPYGDLLMEVLTKEIKLKHQEDNIQLKIDYELYANNSKVSDNIINIEVNPASY